MIFSLDCQVNYHLSFQKKKTSITKNKLQHTKSKYTITELKLIDIINVTTKTQNTYISPGHELINSGKA